MSTQGSSCNILLNTAMKEILQETLLCHIIFPTFHAGEGGTPLYKVYNI